MTGRPSSRWPRLSEVAPLVHIDRMPDELFTKALSLLHVFEIARAMGVSRAWWSAILRTPALWARLDLREAHYLGLQYLPLLLARSVEAPLDLAFEDHGNIGLPPAGQLQATLEPVLHRIRSFEFHAPDINIYLPIFELLRGPAPLLTSLDLTSTGWFAIQMMRGDLPAHDEHLVHLAAQLRFLDCGEHVLPLPQTVFPNVRHLRIAVSTRDKESLEQLFSQFPLMTTLRIYRNFADLPELPEHHPLHRLEIFAKPDLYGDVPPDLSWAHLRALGFLRVSELDIRDFTFSVLAEISKDAEWTARSARLDAGNLFDASFDSVSVSGTRTCMSGMSLRNATHQLEAQKLMYRNAFWRSVTDLTISSIKRPPREQSLAPLLFPVVRAPELTTLTMLFELPAPSNAGLNWAASGPKTLLDADLAPAVGVLRADALRTIRLVAMQSDSCWDASPKPGAIPEASLSDFVVRHIQPGTEPLIADLVFDRPRVYLVRDTEGTSANPGIISYVNSEETL